MQVKVRELPFRTKWDDMEMDPFNPSMVKDNCSNHILCTVDYSVILWEALDICQSHTYAEAATIPVFSCKKLKLAGCPF